VVRQIAGLVARRIVCTRRVGDQVSRGQRIGLIKLGSRTELEVGRSDSFSILVKPGDRVRGGSTILARIRGNSK
jgi:phosphatidylserine decarboxylase